MAAMWNGQTCPVCEVGKLTKVKKDVPFTFNKKTVTFNDIDVFVCDTCEDGSIIEDKWSRVIDYTLMEFRRNIKSFM